MCNFRTALRRRRFSDGRDQRRAKRHAMPLIAAAGVFSGEAHDDFRTNPPRARNRLCGLNGENGLGRLSAERAELFQSFSASSTVVAVPADKMASMSRVLVRRPQLAALLAHPSRSAIVAKPCNCLPDQGSSPPAMACPPPDNDNALARGSPQLRRRY